MPTAFVLSWMRKALLLDSWSGQIDTGLSARALENRTLNLHTRIIPPKTIKYCQPLDVYFSRQYKLFARRIEQNIRHYEGNSVKLHGRIFVFMLHFLIYNQSTAVGPAVACAPIMQHSIPGRDKFPGWGFSSPARQMSGSFRPPRSPNIIWSSLSFINISLRAPMALDVDAP